MHGINMHDSTIRYHILRKANRPAKKTTTYTSNEQEMSCLGEKIPALDF
jgi:hypothetical protein